jgi:superfamily II DNA helicase RecQ
MFTKWIRAAGDATRPPLLMLTATLPAVDRAKLCVALGLKHQQVKIIEHYVFSSEEIYIEMADARPGPMSHSEFAFIDDVIKELHSRGSCAEKCIIVCNTVKVLDRLVAYLSKQFPVVGKIGRGVWLEGMLWARFDGVSTSDASRKGIVEQFKKTLSTLRLVVGTTAVIMGLNMKTVSRVMFIGVPHRMWYLVQLLGRAGRDGCK